MKVTNRKVFEVNLDLLRSTRVYGVKNNTFGWFICVSMIIGYILQNVDFLYSYKTITFDNLIIRFFVSLCVININSKGVPFLLKPKLVDNVMEFVNEVWDTVESSKDPIEMDILNKTLNRGRKIILFNLVSMVFGTMLFVANPLLTGVRELPFEWYIPGVDTHASPLYEILYAYQSLFLAPRFCAIYVASLNLMVVWLMFGFAAFQLLAEKIRRVTLHDTDREKIEALSECIRFHIKIIDYIRVVEDLISVVTFFEINVLSIMLCLLMYCITYFNENTFMLMTVISYVNGVLYMVFMRFLHANDLTYESVTIADAIYNLNWYEQSKPFKSSMIVFMMRSQNPIELTAVIYPLTLPTFVQLMKASYSYLTFLQQAKN